jgi:hypothetical protein
MWYNECIGSAGGFMAKTNYSKVEGSFDDGLRKIMVGKLLEEADANQGKGAIPTVITEQKNILLALHHELRYLQKLGLEPYKKLGILRKKMAKWIEHPETVTEEEWKAIKKFKEGADKLRAISVAKKPLPAYDKEDQVEEGPNDTLVNTERKKSVYKRFNINDKWLPLQ